MRAIRALGSPSVAVIVPVFDEAAAVPELVRALGALRGAGGLAPEIAIVDGGSRDGTPDELRRCLTEAGVAAHVIEPGAGQEVGTTRGRARQMNAGARATTAPVLLFLHADTRLAPGALATVERAIDRMGAGFGCFAVAIDSADARLKLASHIISLRSRLMCSATGDQAIFVRRDLFDRVGGYPEIALCEDLALIGRLCGLARFACLEPPAVTSARRWERNGVLRTIALMWTIRAAFHLGVSPTRLAALYGAAR